MKDYYDVYLLCSSKDLINYNTFKLAFNSTIKNRNSSFYLTDYEVILNELKTAEK